MVALLPSALKIPLYRALFGYRIGKRVRIGLTILDADVCTIDDDVQIGHLNLITRVGRLRVGDHARVGHLNIIRGGADVNLGRYVEVLRMNEINSIPDPDVSNPVDPTFVLGAGSVITAGHKIDFTDAVRIGSRTILGGRHSSIWTHNRQSTKPCTIGSHCYVGSEIRMAPGASVADRCIVGLGAVITKAMTKPEMLVAGVPAAEVRPLEAEDLVLVDRPTRRDLPDDVA